MPHMGQSGIAVTVITVVCTILVGRAVRGVLRVCTVVPAELMVQETPGSAHGINDLEGTCDACAVVVKVMG